MATTGIWIRTFMRGKLKASRANIAVVIDGVTHKLPWGEQLLAVPPGDHSVSVHWGPQRKKTWRAVCVEVPEGAQVGVRYDAPRWTWQPGKLSVES
jgi:hypothetical protein